jgi:hypothetical protein
MALALKLLAMYNVTEVKTNKERFMEAEAINCL